MQLDTWVESSSAGPSGVFQAANLDIKHVACREQPNGEAEEFVRVDGDGGVQRWLQGRQCLPHILGALMFPRPVVQVLYVPLCNIMTYV